MNRFTWLLVGALVLGVLAGCSGGSDEPAKPKADAEAKADANAAAASTYVDPMAGYKPRVATPGQQPAPAGSTHK